MLKHLYSASLICIFLLPEGQKALDELKVAGLLFLCLAQTLDTSSSYHPNIHSFSEHSPASISLHQFSYSHTIKCTMPPAKDKSFRDPRSKKLCKNQVRGCPWNPKLPPSQSSFPALTVPSFLSHKSKRQPTWIMRLPSCPWQELAALHTLVSRPHFSQRNDRDSQASKRALK